MTASPGRSLAALPRPLRLHVGSGPQRLEGWVNVDRQDLPEVDLVADVTAGLPVGDGEAEAVFAEHFLEHLPLDHAVAFLREAHRVLAPEGWLRLTTPNLDWVVATHYLHRDDPVERALGMNLAFHGWSHRFLWNRALLGEALAACGFERVAWRGHGESGEPFLRELERHERYPDTEELPHVLVVEARRGAVRPEAFAALRARLEPVLGKARPIAHRVDEERSRALVRVPTAGALGRMLREHVAVVPLRGHLRLVPEAPEDGELALATVLPRLELDGRAPRRRLGLPRVPERVRWRLEERLVGAARRSHEPHLDASLRGRVATVRDPRHLVFHGALGWRDRSVPVRLELELEIDGDRCRARGELTVPLGGLGLGPWRLAGGSLCTGEKARVELDVSAVAHYPT